MAKEIERKFLVKDLSIIEGLNGDEILQGYLSPSTVKLSTRKSDPALFVSALAQDMACKIDVPLADAEGLAKLLAGEHVTVRVRVLQHAALLTLKGPTDGISRDEFEYAIAPSLGGAFLLGPHALPGRIQKTRYTVGAARKTFEIDVFGGHLAGLVVAEIELAAADEAFILPDWVGAEVSHDPRYFNSNLALASEPPV